MLKLMLVCPTCGQFPCVCEKPDEEEEEEEIQKYLERFKKDVEHSYIVKNISNLKSHFDASNPDDVKKLLKE